MLRAKSGIMPRVEEIPGSACEPRDETGTDCRCRCGSLFIAWRVGNFSDLFDISWFLLRGTGGVLMS